MLFRKTHRAAALVVVPLAIACLVAFHPECQWIHNSLTQGLVASPTSVVLGSHSQPVQSVAFSGDAAMLASGSGWPPPTDNEAGQGEAKIWPLTAKGPRTDIPTVPGGAFTVAFSTDCRTLLTGGWGDAVRFWDPLSGKGRREAAVRVKRVIAMGVSPPGAIVFGHDIKQGLTGFWDLETGQLVNCRDTSFTAAFSPDARFAVSVHYVGDEPHVRVEAQVHDLTSRSQRSLGMSNPIPVCALALAPEGRIVAAGNGEGEVFLWDVASGQEHARLRVAGELETISALAFTPDGRFLAVSSLDRAIQIWEVASSRLRAVLRGHTGAVIAIAFSPDGRQLASGSFDKSVRLWDVERIVKK